MDMRLAFPFVAVCLYAPLAMAEDAHQAIRQLEAELEEQRQRIDRLYQALEPHLDELEAQAEYRREQAEEDQALALERVTEIPGSNLTYLGCANPAAPEFAVVSSEGHILLFDSTGDRTDRYQQPGQIVSAVAYSPDGSELLAGTKTGDLLIWDTSTGICTGALANVGQEVGRVAWVGPTGIAWGGYVRYWEEGKPINHDKAAGGVLDRTTGEDQWSLRANIIPRRFSLSGSRDGSTLLVLEIPGLPRAAYVLDGSSGEILNTCYDAQHGSGPLSLAQSPDGTVFAAGYAPTDIILWNIKTGERLRLLKGHTNWVVSLAFSPDGKRLVSGAGDSTTRVWDVATGNEIGRLRIPGSSSYTYSVGWSPDGSVIFSLSAQGLIIAKVP